MKALAIGGVPGTGKSILMSFLLRKLQPESKLSIGACHGYLKNSTFVIGLYPKGEVFGGTDKLSMSVQPDFQKVVDSRLYNLVFEGDRLFTLTNLKELNKKYDTKIIILECEEDELENRYADRGSNQNEKFLKGRGTKIQNIIDELEASGTYHERRSLYTLDQSQKLAQECLEWLEE